MEFKKLFLNAKFIPVLLGILIVMMILWKFIPKSDVSNPENDGVSSSQDEPYKESSIKQKLETGTTKEPVSGASIQEDAAIQEQLDHDRQEQKQTKYLKTKLEQTNLELEEEKVLAEINKLKMENGTFKEPTTDGQKGFPEVKVEYIGGDAVKKEAILSIAGINYQVKEKSSPIDSIQVVSVSDSSVTLHFSSPKELTKTIDYKPE